MTETLKSYKDLVVWQKSITLIVSLELAFCTANKAQPVHRLVEEVQKMADALRRSLASRL